MDMDMDMVCQMRVEELKSFLKLRGLKTTGRKDELIARVFVAQENNVALIKDAVEVEEDLKRAYEDKLKLEGRSTPLPDPFKIPHGWMEEEDGVVFWPMLTYPDIFNYLMFFPSELGSKDLSDYKMCKAYSYYKDGWLKPLQYHNLSGSKFCILRGQCRASMHVSEYHKLWIIVEKAGKIVACHCNCMNGMSQTCNHVAAAMFRVESAVRNGLTNPACTSKPNQWLPESQAVADITGRICDLDFSRHDFDTRGKKKRPLASSERKNFG